MKKNISILLCIIFVFLFCACDSSETENKILSIVCTAFPQYDIAKNIMGGDDCITLLVDDGSDLHSYEPTVQDIVKIKNSDLFIYVGGVSDEWVKKVLEASDNQNAKTISLLECSTKLYYCDDEFEHDEQEHDPSHADEHVWLSLENACSECEAICDAICEIDPDNSEKYKTNAEEYILKLNKLDSEYKKLSGNQKPVLFADRFPFAYLMDEYSINYYAAFPGCSSEASASFELMAKLIEFTKTNELHSVIIIEGSNGSIAKALKNEIDVNILTMNSCQSVTATDIENGASYLEIMQRNLEILREAMS